MTRDEVMLLANKTAGQSWMDEAHIQRFAALVAAHEREACAETAMCFVNGGQEIANAIRARGNV